MRGELRPFVLPSGRKINKVLHFIRSRENTHPFVGGLRKWVERCKVVTDYSALRLNIAPERPAAIVALDSIQDFALPNQQRLERMRGQIPTLQINEHLSLGENWQHVKQRIEDFKNNTLRV